MNSNPTFYHTNKLGSKEFYGFTSGVATDLYFKFSADRLSSFYIDVYNDTDGTPSQQCAYDTVAYEPSETRVYVCPSEIYGRFVRIRFDSSKTEYMQLCEVQVQGSGESHFYRPQTKFAKVMFFYTCLSFCPPGGGGIPACIAGGIPACLAGFQAHTLGGS